MLDTKILYSLQTLGEDFLCEIITIYLRDLRRYAGQIEMAVKERSTTDGEIASHSLKGASYSLGANALGDVCYFFERGFDDNNFEGMEAKLDALKVEVDLAESELIHLKQKLMRLMDVYSER